MRTINKYIVEKLRINNNTKSANETDFYFHCSISDFNSKVSNDDVQKFLDKLNQISDPWDQPIGMGKEIINKRTGENKLWYAIYLCLLDKGPMKQKDIISFLKPNSNGKSQYATVFSMLRRYNIIQSGEGAQRGLQIPQPFDKWNDFSNKR